MDIDDTFALHGLGRVVFDADQRTDGYGEQKNQQDAGRFIHHGEPVMPGDSLGVVAGTGQQVNFFRDPGMDTLKIDHPPKPVEQQARCPYKFTEPQPADNQEGCRDQ